MPEFYENIDVKTYLLEKCNTEEERDRVLIEYKLFEQKLCQKTSRLALKQP